MSKQFLVYWAHLPSHADMFTEGYIGITSKSIDKRIWQHRNSAKNGKKTRFYDALRKHGEVIVFETILTCSKEYAEFIEAKLRPLERIGWNIAVGGFSGNAHLRKYKPISEESRKRRSDSAKKNFEIHAETAKRVHTGRVRSDETRLKISNSLKGRIFTEEQKLNLSIATAGKVKWNCSRANKQLWSIADFLFNAWVASNKCGVKNLASILSINKHSLINIHKHFRNGWNPLEDIEWQKFKQNYLKEN